MSQNQSLPDKSSLPPVNAEELTHLYREMLLIRRVEELAAKAYTQRKIRDCHLYIGQESVAVGAAVSTKDDYWMAAYRARPGHGQGCECQGDDGRASSERDGFVQGPGCSMHIFDRENGFMGGYGIVGGHVPLATGVACAKQRKEGKVAVCFFGDGAANQVRSSRRSPRPALQAACGLHLREQLLRHGYPASPPVRADRHESSCAGCRHGPSSSRASTWRWSGIVGGGSGLRAPETDRYSSRS